MSSPPGGPASGSGPEDLSAKMPLFAELQRLLGSSVGPVNWELARQVAIRTAAERVVPPDEAPPPAAPEGAAGTPMGAPPGAGLAGLGGSGLGIPGLGLPGLDMLGGTGAPIDPDADRVAAGDVRAVEEALRLADLWLDEVTAFPSGLTRPPEAFSRVRWVEETLPAWRALCEPVAEQVVAAMSDSLAQGLRDLGTGGLPPEVTGGLPPEVLANLPADMASALGPMKEIMGQVGGLLFGAQLGQALGTLAREVVSGSDIGLPLTGSGVAALLPANIALFGDGLGVAAGDVRLYVALREAARQRLFGHVPWLRSRLFDAVTDYARGIRVDPEAIRRAIGSVDPTDPSSLQRALGDGMYEPEPTAEQQAALGRLETLLALVEGWVDEVVATAATPLPSAPALQESVRRRRAAGGPAEQTFAALVGLDLRPRRLREAAAIWRLLAEARGVAGRDALWEHPDLLPGPTDLDAPAAFAAGAGGVQLDFLPEPPGEAADPD